MKKGIWKDKWTFDNKGNPTHKMCPRCKKLKTTSNFTKNSSSKHGIDYVCNCCKLIHRQENKKEKKELIYTFDNNGIVTHKVCSKCNKNKSVDLFYKNKSKNAGINNECKSCNVSINIEKSKTDRTYLYNTWHHMKQRCYSVKSPRFKNYGKRGIKICNEWLDNFELFYSWAISNKTYVHGLQIDRIDNDGDYHPSNCQFLSNRSNCRKQKQHKLSMETAELLRCDFANGVSIGLIVDRYNVSISHARSLNNPNILSFRHWRTENWLIDNPIPEKLKKKKK